MEGDCGDRRVNVGRVNVGRVIVRRVIMGG